MNEKALRSRSNARTALEANEMTLDGRENVPMFKSFPYIKYVIMSLILQLKIIRTDENLSTLIRRK